MAGPGLEPRATASQPGPPGAAAARPTALDPRHAHVVPVLFRSQALHVPEKLKVIIRRCDKQSAWKCLRRILLVLPLPYHGLARAGLSTLSQLGMQSFGALGFHTERSLHSSATTSPQTGRCLRAGVCLIHWYPQCPEQGVAPKRCLAKIC